MRILLILLSLILTIGCTNSKIILHKKTNTSIRVLDGISEQKAQEILSYVYKNYKIVSESYMSAMDNVDESFKDIRTISLWNRPGEIIRNKKCKYSVNFYYPNPVNPEASTGVELCVSIVNNQLKVLGASHWMGN